MSNFEAMAEKTIKNIIFITPDRNDTKGAIVLGTTVSLRKPHLAGHIQFQIGTGSPENWGHKRPLKVKWGLKAESRPQGGTLVWLTCSGFTQWQNRRLVGQPDPPVLLKPLLAPR